MLNIKPSPAFEDVREIRVINKIIMKNKNSIPHYLIPAYLKSSTNYIYIYIYIYNYSKTNYDNTTVETIKYQSARVRVCTHYIHKQLYTF